MSRRRARGLWVFRPGLEALEARRVRAQFGVPWHDPEHLSVSFIPDGTAIAGDRSSLFALLDAAEPTAAWQAEILGAFRAWADAAQISFALEPDDGAPLGTPGPDQGDPRFGDIRIGARPMSPEVLSISVPHDPFLSGTWSGDILLNSSIAFDRGVNLVPVVLHEIGHVLGLDDSDDPHSVMFGHFDAARTTLSAEDVSAIDALYGPPEPDRFEGRQRNDRPETATPFPVPAGFDGSTPLLLYASLDVPTDTDVFTIQPPAGYDGPMTVWVQTAGVSLLAPQLAVLGADGTVLDEVSSTAAAGDTLRITLPRVEPGARYFVQVRAAPGDVVGVGRYALAVSFDARSTAGPDAIDRLARQSYDYLAPEGIEAIFRDPEHALFRDDHHSDDSLAAAVRLNPIGAYGSEAPYRLTASLSDRTDIDFYRIETPENDEPGRPLVMTATVRLTDVNGLPSRVAVFDRAGKPVAATVDAHGAGTYTVQVADAQPETIYVIRVDHDPGSAKESGNYELDVEFGHQAAAPVDFVGGTLDTSHPRAEYDLVVNEAQLVDFLLFAETAAGASRASLRMTIDDLQGRFVAARSARSGETDGGASLLLLPGVYVVTFELEPNGPGVLPPMTFRLYGASLSDPIGPALDDPTLAPVSDPSQFGPSPLVLGSPAAPYAWLARSLAARPDSSETSPIAPGGAGMARLAAASAPVAIAPAPSPANRATPATRSDVTGAAFAGTGLLPVRAVAQGAAPPTFGLSRSGGDPVGGPDGDPSYDQTTVLSEIDGASPAIPDLVLDGPRWSVRKVSLRSPASEPQVPATIESRAAATRPPTGGRVISPERASWAAVDFGPHAVVVFWVAAMTYDHARRRRGADRAIPRGFASLIPGPPSRSTA